MNVSKRENKMSSDSPYPRLVSSFVMTARAVDDISGSARVDGKRASGCGAGCLADFELGGQGHGVSVFNQWKVVLSERSLELVGSGH